jgi:hypothetical protein
MSAVIDLSRAWSQMWGSRWNRITISFRSKVISTSGLMTAILGSGCRSMSNNVGSAISKSSMVEN